MKQIKNYIYNMKHINAYKYGMKNIKNYINEKLHITTKSNIYTCYPKTRKELSSIIIERIESEGVECDLNDIDVSNIEDMTSLFEPNSFLSTETVLFEFQW